MRRLVPFLLVAAACFGDDPSPPPAAPALGPEVGPAAPPVATPAERLQSARDALLGGDAAKALRDTEALLGESPDDAATARFLLVAAVAAGDARGAADRLGPDPRGAQAAAHHLLRADLLLAAGDPAAADAAARLALADAPHEAAAVLALARRAGAPPAAGASPSDPVEALAVLVSAADLRAATPAAAGAAGVAGWRAALARGEAWARLGDSGKALAEFSAAAADADPRAVIAANLGRARLAAAEPAPKKGGAKPVGPAPGEAGAWAVTAEQAALAEGDLAQAVTAFELARSNFALADRPADSFAAIAALHDRLVAVGATAEAARHAFSRAELAWQAGAWKDAAATAAAGRAAAGPDAAAHAWVEARALAALGRAAALEPVLPSLTEGQAAAVKGLAAVVSGADLAGSVPVAGLPDADAAELLLVAALRGGPGAAAHAKAATAAADRSGRRSLRVLSRLVASELAQAAGERAWRAPLTELSGLASGGLGVETAVRQAVVGGGGSVGAGDGIQGLWSGLLSGASVPASGVVGAALSALAEGRQALGAGDAGKASQAFAAGVGALPFHRRGLASAGTALDGSAGLVLDEDLARLAALPVGDDVLGAALALHEGVHRLRGWRGGHAVGRDPLVGLGEAEREAILDAAARARGAMVGYWLGGAAFPSAAFEALDAAEKAAAGAQAAYRAGLPGAVPTVANMRTNLPNAAVISHIATDAEVHGLVVTAASGAVRGLGPVARLAPCPNAMPPPCLRRHAARSALRMRPVTPCETRSSSPSCWSSRASLALSRSQTLRSCPSRSPPSRSRPPVCASSPTSASSRCSRRSPAPPRRSL